LKRQRYSKEQIRQKLDRANAALTGGATIPEICRTLRISEATFHRWRRRFNLGEKHTAVHEHETPGHGNDRVRLLERENRRLKMLVGELMLEIAYLKDTLQGKQSR
jgi:transposase-like protein